MNDAITAMRPAYLVLINKGLLKAWVLDFRILTKQIHRQRASQAENAAGLSALPLLSSPSHRNALSSLSLSLSLYYDVASPPPFLLHFLLLLSIAISKNATGTVTSTLSCSQTYTRAHTHLVDSSNLVCTGLVQAGSFDVCRSAAFAGSFFFCSLSYTVQ
jgi:hypothetical protein